MRLIDADKLIKTLLNQERTENEIKYHCLNDENVIALIQNAPTIYINEPTLNESIVFQDGYELGKSERPLGEWSNPIITLFNKYNVLLVHIDNKIVPVKNTSKQDCYNLLYEIQELINWRVVLFEKYLNQAESEADNV